MGHTANIGEWFPLQNKAWPHMALFIKEFLSICQITILPHEPYSSDLSLWDFFSFLWLKQALKGHRYADIQASHMAVTKRLCNIPECLP